MTIVKQAWQELRSQPVIGAITVTGTALAIFLIMVVVMTGNIKTATIAPESNRNRMLHERHMALCNLNGDGSGSSLLSYRMAKDLFCDLESAEVTTVYSSDPWRASARVAAQKPVKIDMRRTDDNYWKVFDHTFLSGRSYTAEEVASHARVAVISEDIAKKLFGTTDCIGREIFINMFNPVEVIGVVRDVPTVTNFAYSSVWLPLNETGMADSDWFGGLMVTILARDRGDFKAIIDETERRKEIVNTRLKADNRVIADHIVPLDSETIHLARYSNIGPDVKSHRNRKLAVYLILLIIPAINLSSMTHSRLRRRVSEMGVRRAFGCTRSRLTATIISENLIITLAGGIAGFILSAVVTWLMADTLFVNHQLATPDTRVSVGMLLNINTFLIALAACFVLNLLSSGLPAWRAARISPTRAIGGLQK